MPNKVSITGLTEWMDGYGWDVDVKFSEDLSLPGKLNGSYRTDKDGNGIYKETDNGADVEKVSDISLAGKSIKEVRKALKAFFSNN